MSKPRIGIIGTISAGKTTLISRVAEQTGIYHSREDARDLYEEFTKDPTWDREDPNNQFQFQTKIYSSRIYREMNHYYTGFIADRTYLDDFMYFLYYCHKITDKEMCQKFERMAVEGMKNYTHLFIVKLDSIPFVNDTIRTDTYSAALFFETSIEGLCKRWNLNVCHISMSNLDNRINYVIKTTGLKTKPKEKPTKFTIDEMRRKVILSSRSFNSIYLSEERKRNFPS